MRNYGKSAISWGQARLREWHIYLFLDWELRTDDWVWECVGVGTRGLRGWGQGPTDWLGTCSAPGSQWHSDSQTVCTALTLIYIKQESFMKLNKLPLIMSIEFLFSMVFVSQILFYFEMQTIVCYFYLLFWVSSEHSTNSLFENQFTYKWYQTKPFLVKKILFLCWI